MNISFDNKYRMNAMYYRDGLTKEEIAHVMKFTLEFVDRYIASVDRRIERGEITKESIINGVNHLKIQGTKKPDMPATSLDGFEAVKLTQRKRGPGPDNPEIVVPLSELPDDMGKRMYRNLMPSYDGAVQLLVQALNRGELFVQSVSMSRDNEYVITLKEVKNENSDPGRR